MNKVKKREINFTEGNIYKELVMFAIPLLLGNLLQQVYFVADSIIVGQLIGSKALAAVGASTSVTVLFIFFFQGIASGAGILISQFVGSGESYKIPKATKVASVFAIAIGTVFAIVAYMLTDNILNWISVPQDVFEDTYKYLKISFIGVMVPMLAYNMGAAVMRAVGDSKTPLYYLALASVINIILDIIFVKYVGMGVEGTAVATVIAQVIAAVCLLIKLWKKQIKEYSKERNDDTPNGKTFKRILVLGMPIGIQDVVIVFSGVIVQNHINGIGSTAMAGWSIFCRVDTFVILPFISFGIAVLTMVGQNYGANKINRVFEGVRAGIIMSVGVTVVIGIIVVIFSGGLFKLFTDDSAAIAYAQSMIWNMVPFYSVLAITRIYSSAVAGTGNSLAPMVTNILFMCVVRIVLIPIFAKSVGHNMEALYYAYWISWALSFVSIWAYYRFRTKNQLKLNIDMI